jgi:hypothetical protein
VASETVVKHTPGPWKVTRQEVGKRGGGGDLIISFSPIKFFFLPFTRENEANARLIAAAPSMFAYIEKRAKEGDTEAAALLEVARGNS